MNVKSEINMYLELIEHISLNMIDDWNIVDKTRALEDIYCLSHILNDRCKEKHIDRRTEYSKMYNELKINKFL